MTFGGITALSEVTISAAPGEVVGIIGPNGAGKTTLFDVISGFTRPQRGTVRLGGIDVTSQAAAGRARAGLGRSFQNSTLFAGLSVRDTLAVALERFIDTGDPVNAALRLPAMVYTEAAVVGRADELIELFGLERFADKFVGELSTGTRRLVDLAAVVAHARRWCSSTSRRRASPSARSRRWESCSTRVQHGWTRPWSSSSTTSPSCPRLADRLVALDEGTVLAQGAPAEVLDRA